MTVVMCKMHIVVSGVQWHWFTRE